MSKEAEGPKKRSGPRRLPPFTVLILGIAVGFLVADWMGAILGGILGGIVWWSRVRV